MTEKLAGQIKRLSEAHNDQPAAALPTAALIPGKI
jgi:hypothetical protein